MSGQGKLVISRDAAVLALLASFLPVWRCGLREDLNFWQWTYFHTTWSPKPQYIPEELYENEGGK